MTTVTVTCRVCDARVDVDAAATRITLDRQRLRFTCPIGHRDSQDIPAQSYLIALLANRVPVEHPVTAIPWQRKPVTAQDRRDAL